MTAVTREQDVIVTSLTPSADVADLKRNVLVHAISPLSFVVISLILFNILAVFHKTKTEARSE